MEGWVDLRGRLHTDIGVNPARVRGSGPSWIWTLTKCLKHGYETQWTQSLSISLPLLMINEWLCDMSHCCHHTRFWALNHPKCVCGRGSAPDPAGELTALPQTPSCVWGGRFAAGKGRGGEGKEWRGEEGNGPSQLWEQVDAHAYRDGLPPAVSHPNTNLARHRVTSWSTPTCCL